jgi:osmoprotectant transport system permease protein
MHEEGRWSVRIVDNQIEVEPAHHVSLTAGACEVFCAPGLSRCVETPTPLRQLQLRYQRCPFSSFSRVGYICLLDPYVLKSLLHDIAESTAEHIFLVGISSLIAVAVGVGLGILGTRRKALRNVSVSIANVFQTIPSLALFGFLLPVPFIGGIGKHTAILCLVLYSLLPVLRNTIVGICSVDAPLREAAIAMGMTDRQLLQMVELPLAAPTILAGVRIALVTNIGTAVIAAIIGGGGLGVLIFRGVESLDTLLILAGAVPAALMALLADGAMSYLEKKVAIR